MATENDRPNNGVIITLVAVGIFAMIAVSAALAAMARAEVRDELAASESYADLKGVRDLEHGQRAKLEEGYAWADRNKGLVSIPIERAMKLVVDDIARDPNLATPVLPQQDEADAGAPAATEGEQAETEEEGAPGGPQGKDESPAPGTEKPGPQGPQPGGASERKAPGGQQPAPVPEQPKTVPEAPKTPTKPAPSGAGTTPGEATPKPPAGSGTDAPGKKPAQGEQQQPAPTPSLTPAKATEP